MKQFIVDRETTPGTPALDPVAIPKMPVYDTEADLDADFANLAEGQMASYPSEGANLSVPVDKVESGDMHAVTSNAVDKAIGEYKRKILIDTYTITNGVITINPNMPSANYKAIVQVDYKSNAPRDFNVITQCLNATTLYIYVTKFDGTSFNNVQINLVIELLYKES